MSVNDRLVKIELAKHEAVIERGMRTTIEVGLAMKAIRDNRLYAEEYDSFESYVKHRWEFSRPRAYQLIEAAEVDANLSTVVDKHHRPQIESQLREVAKAPIEQQAEVVRKVAERAAEENRKPTARDYKKVVGELLLEESEEKSVEPIVENDSVVDLALQNGKALSTIVGLLQKAKRESKSIEEQPGLEVFVSREKSIQRDIDAAIGAIQVTIPYAVCPRCNGQCCVQCGNHGWVNKALFKSLEGSGE